MNCVAPASDHQGKLPEPMQWIPIFFTSVYSDLKEISKTAGVRERWLQGQIYLHLKKDGNDIQLEKSISVTPFKTPKGRTKNQKKFDIVLDDKFAIELKVIGASHYKKMFNIFERDFQRLISITDETYSSGRYVMLVFVKEDELNPKIDLSEKLQSYSNSKISKPYFTHDYGQFSVKVWRVLNTQ